MGLGVFYVIFFFKNVFINSLSSYLGQFMSMNNLIVLGCLLV